MDTACSRWSSKRYTIVCAIIVVLGFFVRASAALVWQSSITDDSHFKWGDSDTYWSLARTIANGTPYQYGSPDSKIFRAPLYPWFLSPWTMLLPAGEKGSWTAIMAARLAGCVLGAVCIGLVMRLASHRTRAATSVVPGGNAAPLNSDSMAFGLWAGLLAMLYPGAIGMSIFVLSESLFCPFMILSLFSTVLAIGSNNDENRRGSFICFVLAGVWSGAGCLTRPSWSLWPVVLFPYLFLVMVPFVPRIDLRKLRKWVTCCVLYCVGICLVMSPWWIRNYSITRKFVPTTLQVGASLYDGWHAGASGSSDEDMHFVNAFEIEQRAEDHQMESQSAPLDGSYEWRLDRRMKNAAIQWACENSSDARKLGLVKLIKTWSPLPVARELGSSAVRWLEAIGYVAIVCFASVGVWHCRHLPGSWLYAMPCLYFAVLHMFFIGSVRYRQPAVLVLCVLGGIGCGELVKWIGIYFVRDKTNFDGSIVSNNVTVDNSTNGNPCE